MIPARRPAVTSSLYHAIQPYLHSSSREHPVIGLNSITELWTHHRPTMFFCESCFQRLSKADIRSHILGSAHRFGYIKSHHEDGLMSYMDLTLLARPLLDIAKEVEKIEGTGNVQVLDVDEITFVKLESLPLEDAFDLLMRVKSHQNVNYLYSPTHYSSEGNEPVQELQGFYITDEMTHLSTLRLPISTHMARPNSECPIWMENPPLIPSVLSQSLYRDLEMSAYTVNNPNPVQFVYPLGPDMIQNNPALRGKPPSPQRCPMPFENPNEATSHILRRMPTITPPRYQSPEISPNQSEEYEDLGSSDGSRSPNQVEEWLQEPSCSLSSVEPAMAQNWSEPEPSEMIDFIKQTRLQMQYERSEAAVATDSSQSRDPKIHSKNQSVDDFTERYSGEKPLIGLQAVIKCQSVQGRPPACRYLCQLCAMKIKKKGIVTHLTSYCHQRNYVKVHHPQLLPVKRKKQKDCNLYDMMDQIARKLEKEDGRGEIKVIRLSECLVTEILKQNYEWCMKVLNCGAEVGWRSDLSVCPPGKAKSTGPGQTTKGPAKPTVCSEKRPLDLPEEDPCVSNHPTCKKIRTSLPQIGPVFKVSLSLQNRPVVIERTSLRNGSSVAPEIENQGQCFGEDV